MNPFAGFSRGSDHGEALLLAGQSVVHRQRPIATLRLAADVVDGETITIGSQVFELVGVTDTTVDTAGGAFNNTTNPLTFTLTAHGLAAGAIIKVENEFMKVISVVDANTLKVSRGYAGTTVAVHADAQDIFSGPAPGTATNIPLPVGVLLTPTAAGPQIATGLTALNSLKISVVQIAVGSILFIGTAPGAEGTVLAETLAGVNNTLDTTMRSGGDYSSAPMQVFSRVPTAAEVAIGAMHFPCDFVPIASLVEVRVTAGGAIKLWDGATTYTAATKLVNIDNGGATDWAVTDTVTVLAVGAPVEAGGAAVPN